MIPMSQNGRRALGSGAERFLPFREAHRRSTAMKCLALTLVQLLAFVLSGLTQAQTPKVAAPSPAIPSVARTDFKTVSPLLRKYCTDCHGGTEPENGLSLEFADARDVEQRL